MRCKATFASTTTLTLLFLFASTLVRASLEGERIKVAALGEELEIKTKAKDEKVSEVKDEKNVSLFTAKSLAFKEKVDALVRPSWPTAYDSSPDSVYRASLAALCAYESRSQSDFCRVFARNLNGHYISTATEIARKQEEDGENGNISALVTVDHKAKQVIVAFAGTQKGRSDDLLAHLKLFSIQDMLLMNSGSQKGEHDEEAEDEEWESVKSVKVHAGYLQKVLTLEAAIMEKLHGQVKNPGEYEFVLTGHSMGSALAVLFAMRLQASGLLPREDDLSNARNQIKLFTFGSVKALVHSGDFASIGHANHLRFDNPEDPIVMHCPRFLALFQWTGIEVAVPGKWVFSAKTMLMTDRDLQGHQHEDFNALANYTAAYFYSLEAREAMHLDRDALAFSLADYKISPLALAKRQREYEDALLGSRKAAEDPDALYSPNPQMHAMLGYAVAAVRAFVARGKLSPAVAFSRIQDPDSYWPGIAKGALENGIWLAKHVYPESNLPRYAEGTVWAVQQVAKHFAQQK